MEQEQAREEEELKIEAKPLQPKKPVAPVLIFTFGLFVGLIVSNVDTIVSWQKRIVGEEPDEYTVEEEDSSALEANVIPSEGFELPVTWKDFGKQLVTTGVIDGEKFEALYANRGGMNEEDKRMLSGKENGNVRITGENSGILLNLLWAFGLGNKNEILEKGPMVDERYGGAGKFASTGGWSISKGDAMNHYSKHSFIKLTKEQQLVVERVSQGIFRPCCNNSTYFPDCNHGMAMLGLLEIMAAQGVSEDEMYSVALKVNSFWFPQTYLTLAKYFEEKGVAWKDVDPKIVLGKDYSSATGYNQILNEVTPVELRQGGGSCGV